MLGPLVNPANPKYQSVGVFSLELARLYGYIYQKTDKQFSILHALDGYDEISLTGDFKLINNFAEQIITLKDLGIEPILAEQIGGGDTVEEAAGIFKTILEGNGTKAQNQVVLANAALAIQTFNMERDFMECYREAEESLIGKKALNSLKVLIN
jgi:anthranilate phosphoribosyltransferase